MRRVIAFNCAGETLVGSLDKAGGSTGLLIVSGGNEVRSGAHRGMARLAAELAALGTPVFRYDRRGVGDSTGGNLGFAQSGDDLAAATAAFRAACPAITRLVGFGNCDGASALALFGAAAGINALILANPWIVEEASDLPPPAAIRARYADRLRDPRQWARLVSGKINLPLFISGLLAILRKQPALDESLEADVFAGIAGLPTVVTLAKRDDTAQSFAAAARRRRYRGSITLIDTASHSFANKADAEALKQAIIAGLR